VLSGGGDYDEKAARGRAGRVFDRVAPASPAVQMANQRGTVFASLKCGPRWRERLGQIQAPTLVVHGEKDPFFPLGNGEALAREIPGARLVALPRTGAVLTPAAWKRVAAEMAAHVAA
jgi:pimeloyl-ACP methyl ester carboxylesterase